MNIYELTEKIIGGRDLSKAGHEKLVLAGLKDFTVALLSELKAPMLAIVDDSIKMTIQADAPAKKMLRAPEVMELLGIKNKQWLYEWQRENGFPEGEKLREPGHPLGYDEKEVKSWIRINKLLLEKAQRPKVPKSKPQAKPQKAKAKPEKKKEKEEEKFVDFKNITPEILKELPYS